MADDDRTTLRNTFSGCIEHGEDIYIGMIKEKLPTEKYRSFHDKGYTDKSMVDYIRSQQRTTNRRFARQLVF